MSQQQKQASPELQQFIMQQQVSVLTEVIDVAVVAEIVCVIQSDAASGGRSVPARFSSQSRTSWRPELVGLHALSPYSNHAVLRCAALCRPRRSYSRPFRGSQRSAGASAWARPVSPRLRLLLAAAAAAGWVRAGLGCYCCCCLCRCYCCCLLCRCYCCCCHWYDIGSSCHGC